MPNKNSHCQETLGLTPKQALEEKQDKEKPKLVSFPPNEQVQFCPPGINNQNMTSFCRGLAVLQQTVKRPTSQKQHPTT